MTERSICDLGQCPVTGRAWGLWSETRRGSRVLVVSTYEAITHEMRCDLALALSLVPPVTVEGWRKELARRLQANGVPSSVQHDAWRALRMIDSALDHAPSMAEVA